MDVKTIIEIGKQGKNIYSTNKYTQERFPELINKGYVNNQASQMIYFELGLNTVAGIYFKTISKEPCFSAGADVGATAGAYIGSVFPVIGTGIGAFAGAGIGGLTGIGACNTTIDYTIGNATKMLSEHLWTAYKDPTKQQIDLSKIPSYFSTTNKNGEWITTPYTDKNKSINNQNKKSEIESGAENALIITRSNQASYLFDNSSDDYYQCYASNIYGPDYQTFLKNQEYIEKLGYLSESAYGLSYSHFNEYQYDPWDNDFINSLTDPYGTMGSKSMFDPPPFLSNFQTSIQGYNTDPVSVKSANSPNSKTSSSDPLAAAGALLGASVTWTFGAGLSVVTAILTPIAVVGLVVMLLNALLSWW